MIDLRTQIVVAARSWLETPFHHQARAKGVGVDCVGLLIGVARDLALIEPDFDFKGYPRTPDGKTLIAECERFMTSIPRAAVQPGDAIAIRWGRDPQHLAFIGDYVHGGLSIIHAFSEVDGSGSVIETHFAPSYQSRVVAAFRLPGVPA